MGARIIMLTFVIVYLVISFIFVIGVEACDYNAPPKYTLLGWVLAAPVFIIFSPIYLVEVLIFGLGYIKHWFIKK